jgi:hypothetical protein
MAPDMYCKAINLWLARQVATTAEKPRPCPHGNVWLIGGQVCMCATDNSGPPHPRIEPQS